MRSDLSSTLIFLAEDDDDMRALLVTALESDGYSVRGVPDGSHLLELLAHATTTVERPDLIITDVMMPGYSGLSILAAVRGAHVVLITARRDEALETDAGVLGVSAFLRKPFDIAELRVAVLNALGNP